MERRNFSLVLRNSGVTSRKRSFGVDKRGFKAKDQDLKTRNLVAAAKNWEANVRDRFSETCAGGEAAIGLVRFTVKQSFTANRKAKPENSKQHGEAELHRK
jgi:hypothetical protein